MLSKVYRRSITITLVLLQSSLFLSLSQQTRDILRFANSARIFLTCVVVDFCEDQQQICKKENIEMTHFDKMQLVAARRRRGGTEKGKDELG